MGKEFFDPATGQMTTAEEWRRRMGGLQPVKGDVTFQKPAKPSANGERLTVDVEVEQVPPRKKS